MVKTVSKQYSFPLALVWAFFILLLFFYGRGLTYSADMAENDINYVVKTISKIPFLVGGVLFLLFITNARKFNLKVISNYRLWILFLLILFVSSFFKTNMVLELREFVMLLFSYCLFFLLIRFVYQIPFRVLEKHFIVISFLICCLTVAVHLIQGNQIVFFPPRNEKANFDRLGGLFYYAHTAAIAGITLLFALKKFIDTRRSSYLLMVVVCALLLMITDTRSTWLATGFSILFLIFKKIRFWKLFLFSIIAYLVMILGEVIILFNAIAFKNVESDSQLRFEIWAYSISSSFDRFIFGFGKDNPLEKRNFLLNDNLHDPHNSLISLLLQSGIIAVVIYLVIFFKNCRLNSRKFDPSYRFLFFFWFFFPFFWGDIYNHLSNFISMYLMFTIYGFALNPRSRTADTKNAGRKLLVPRTENVSLLN